MATARHRSQERDFIRRAGPPLVQSGNRAGAVFLLAPLDRSDGEAHLLITRQGSEILRNGQGLSLCAREHVRPGPFIGTHPEFERQGG